VVFCWGVTEARQRSAAARVPGMGMNKSEKKHEIKENDRKQ
jgi:hypothetical protein